MFLANQSTGEEFQRRIVDQFDVLYDDSRASARVMCIALHPFLVGHHFRSKYLDLALGHMRERHEVWWATGSEICRWYRDREHERRTALAPP